MNSPRIYGEKVWLLLLVRAAVWTQSLSLSFFLVLHSICAPTFHPHIKAIHHQDQNHCVGPRQPDLLVGFFCLWVLWLGSRARDTQIHFWQGLSLANAVSATFCAFSFFCTDQPMWIAGPHVNVTSKANKWVPAHARWREPAAAAIRHWKNTTQFIQDPLSKSVKFRVLLIKMCPFCLLRLIMKQIYCNFLVCCKMWPHTFWWASCKLDTLLPSCWEYKEDEGKLQKRRSSE